MQVFPFLLEQPPAFVFGGACPVSISQIQGIDQRQRPVNGWEQFLVKREAYLDTPAKPRLEYRNSKQTCPFNFVQGRL
jgi:hypothetical protein